MQSGNVCVTGFYSKFVLTHSIFCAQMIEMLVES